MRALLSTTIQEYTTACSNLTVAWAQFPHLLRDSLVKDVCKTINTELEAAPFDEEALRRSQLSMAMLRNSLSPINRLPPEILANIFMISSNHCVHALRLEGPPDVLDVFSAVSVHWRRVALSTSALWTHIDISANLRTNLFYQHAKLLLERSRGLHIHLHVCEARPMVNRTDEMQLHELGMFLLPHMSRVSTLEISTQSSSRRFIDFVLDLWLKRGSSGSVKALTVQRPQSDRMVDLKKPLGYLDDPIRSELLQKLFLPVRVLRLQSTVLR